MQFWGLERIDSIQPNTRTELKNVLELWKIQILLLQKWETSTEQITSPEQFYLSL